MLKLATRKGSIRFLTSTQKPDDFQQRYIAQYEEAHQHDNQQFGLDCENAVEVEWPTDKTKTPASLTEFARDNGLVIPNTVETIVVIAIDGEDEDPIDFVTIGDSEAKKLHSTRGTKVATYSNPDESKQIRLCFHIQQPTDRIIRGWCHRAQGSRSEAITAHKQLINTSAPALKRPLEQLLLRFTQIVAPSHDVFTITPQELLRKLFSELAMTLRFYIVLCLAKFEKQKKDVVFFAVWDELEVMDPTLQLDEEEKLFFAGTAKYLKKLEPELKPNKSDKSKTFTRSYRFNAESDAEFRRQLDEFFDAHTSIDCNKLLHHLFKIQKYSSRTKQNPKSSDEKQNPKQNKKEESNKNKEEPKKKHRPKPHLQRTVYKMNHKVPFQLLVLLNNLNHRTIFSSDNSNEFVSKMLAEMDIVSNNIQNLFQWKDNELEPDGPTSRSAIFGDLMRGYRTHRGQVLRIIAHSVGELKKRHDAINVINKLTNTPTIREQLATRIDQHKDHVDDPDRSGSNRLLVAALCITPRVSTSQKKRTTVRKTSSDQEDEQFTSVESNHVLTGFCTEVLRCTWITTPKNGKANSNSKAIRTDSWWLGDCTFTSNIDLFMRAIDCFAMLLNFAIANQTDIAHQIGEQTYHQEQFGSCQSGGLKLYSKKKLPYSDSVWDAAFDPSHLLTQISYWFKDNQEISHMIQLLIVRRHALFHCLDLKDENAFTLTALEKDLGTMIAVIEHVFTTLYPSNVAEGNIIHNIAQHKLLKYLHAAVTHQTVQQLSGYPVVRSDLRWNSSRIKTYLEDTTDTSSRDMILKYFKQSLNRLEENLNELSDEEVLVVLSLMEAHPLRELNTAARISSGESSANCTEDEDDDPNNPYFVLTNLD